MVLSGLKDRLLVGGLKYSNLCTIISASHPHQRFRIWHKSFQQLLFTVRRNHQSLEKWMAPSIMITLGPPEARRHKLINCFSETLKRIYHISILCCVKNTFYISKYLCSQKHWLFFTELNTTCLSNLPKIHTGKKEDSLLTNGVVKTGRPHIEEWNLALCRKINSKWIKGLSVDPEILKLL